MAGTRSRRHLHVVDGAGTSEDAPSASGCSEPSGFRPAAGGVELAIVQAAGAWLALVREQQVERATIEQTGSGIFEVACDLAGGGPVWLRVSLTLAHLGTVLETRVEPVRPE